MEIHYKLNEQEIKNIIAEHFHTSHKNIELLIFQNIEGYGLNENIKNCIQADIYYMIKDNEKNGNDFN